MLQTQENIITWNFIDLRLFKKLISVEILITPSSVSEWPNILWLPKEKKVNHVRILRFQFFLI